jgi:hypothetical protein
MSIAVMNWVWANSPTSGNERLVLLAQADACSRDGGTGCWPSAATIARKANISDRTVRRAIARMEADGQLIVHRAASDAELLGAPHFEDGLDEAVVDSAGASPRPPDRRLAMRGQEHQGRARPSRPGIRCRCSRRVGRRTPAEHDGRSSEDGRGGGIVDIGLDGTDVGVGVDREDPPASRLNLRHCDCDVAVIGGNEPVRARVRHVVGVDEGETPGSEVGQLQPGVIISSNGAPGCSPASWKPAPCRN